MLDLAKAKEKRKEEQQSIRRQLGRGRLSLDTFQKGDRDRIQDPRTKTWRMTGTVTSTIHHEGSESPSTYTVEADSGRNFLRNGRFLRMLSKQCPPDSPEATGVTEQDDEAVQGNQTPSNFKKHDYASETQETVHSSGNSEASTQGIEEPGYSSRVQAELPKVQSKRRNPSRRVQFANRVDVIRTLGPCGDYVQIPSNPPNPLLPVTQS